MFYLWMYIDIFFLIKITLRMLMENCVHWGNEDFETEIRLKISFLLLIWTLIQNDVVTEV